MADLHYMTEYSYIFGGRNAVFMLCQNCREKIKTKEHSSCRGKAYDVYLKGLVESDSAFVEGWVVDKYASRDGTTIYVLMENSGYTCARYRESYIVCSHKIEEYPELAEAVDDMENGRTVDVDI